MARSGDAGGLGSDGPQTEAVTQLGGSDDLWGDVDRGVDDPVGSGTGRDRSPGRERSAFATGSERLRSDRAAEVTDRGRGDGGVRAGRTREVGRFRGRILPRTVLGIACLILAFAIGAGFSGVVLFSYYQYKLNQTNDRVNTLISGYKKQFANAEGDLSASAAAAQATIQNQLRALQQLQAGPATLAALVKQVAPSVFFVHTLDANGQASVGTAFVVSSNSTESLLLTSYTTVQAATRSPGPAVFVQQGQTNTQVTVHSWDPEYDLALLVLPRGGLHALPAASLSPGPQPGDPIYAVSGLGTAGASITQGSITDVSSNGIAVDAAIAQAFQGGPLIDHSGQVLAVASRTYSPLGFSSQGVWYAPYVEAACNKVLICPGGTLAGSS
jgi:Trypsin-like peptidase domain